jgi:alpha-beta hydrolase superfamily lysophospholipase
VSTPPEGESLSLVSSDGLDLAIRYWSTSRPRRWTFVVSHGLGEHAGRYRRFAAWFVARGVSVYALDHRGHGQSGGPRGHAPSQAALIDDLDRVITLATTRDGVKPVLVGHSMGGVIAIAYALAHPDRIQRAVFSAPALIVKQRIPLWKRAIAPIHRVLPRLTAGNGLNAHVVSRDPSVVDAYAADPLVHDRISARLNAVTMGQGPSLIARAGELRVPFLLLHGGADALIDPQGSQRFFMRATTPGRHFRHYPGLYHEVFNEPEQEQVFQDILDWLAEPV